MQRDDEATKAKPAKQSYAAAAKLATMRLYYGFVNKYSSGKARQIELQSPDDEIILLGRRFKGGLGAEEEKGDNRRRVNSSGENSPTLESTNFERIEQPLSEDLQQPKMESNNTQVLEVPSPTLPPGLKKNRSDSSLDKKDDLTAANEELCVALAYVACFTYRAHWGEPIPNTKLFSDVGWGCMIRVGQMAFFNCLIRDQLLIGEDFLHDRLNYLLILFNDFNEGEIAPFSIKNIVPLAFDKFNIPMGNWFRSTSIMMALDHLNKIYKPHHTSHIKMVTMLDATFLLSRLFEAFTELGALGMDESAMLEVLCKPWNEKRLIITLTSMLGIDKPQREYQKCLNFLLSLPASVGILGGSDNRAYYIVGYNKSKKVYYYLDPHAVQNAVSVDNHAIDSYFKKEVYEIGYDSLNPSLAFAFFFANPEEILTFWHALKANKTEAFYAVVDKETEVDFDDVIVML